MAVLWFKPWMGEFKLSDLHYLWHHFVMPSGKMVGSGMGTYTWNVNFHYPLMSMKTWERWTFILEMLKSKRYHAFQGQLSVCNVFWKKSAPCVWKAGNQRQNMKKKSTLLLSIDVDTSSTLVAWLWIYRFTGTHQFSSSVKRNGIWALMPLNIHEDFRPDRWTDNCFALSCHLCQTLSTSHYSGRSTQDTGTIF